MSPQIGFQCPDGQHVTHEQCLNNPCRMGERCLSHGYLALLKPYREWTGKPSVTQLLQPVLQQWLQIKWDFYILPARQTYRLLGSRVHLKLSLTPSEKTLVEQACGDEDRSGIFDAYQREDGVAILYDHKTWGSYQIKKALKGDMFESKMQLNMYRILIQKAGMPVDKLRIQAFPRDGNLEIAQIRGVANVIRPIPVPLLPDSYVLDYFDNARELLLTALASEEPPPKCNPAENWKGRRCTEYCNVNTVCPYVGSKRKKMSQSQLHDNPYGPWPGEV